MMGLFGIHIVNGKISRAEPYEIYHTKSGIKVEFEYGKVLINGRVLTKEMPEIRVDTTVIMADGEKLGIGTTYHGKPHIASWYIGRFGVPHNLYHWYYKKKSKSYSFMCDDAVKTIIRENIKSISVTVPNLRELQKEYKDWKHDKMYWSILDGERYGKYKERHEEWQKREDKRNCK